MVRAAWCVVNWYIRWCGLQSHNSWLRKIVRLQTAPTVVGLGIALLILLVGCFRSNSETPPPAIFPMQLTIDAPAQIAAGKPLTVTVHTLPNIITEPILLMARGSFGTIPQLAIATNGVATYHLTREQTRFAGTVALTANAGGIASQTTVEILPGAAADPILPLVGPRSIVADGKHWTMVVTTVRDRFLNPIAEGSPLIIRVQHPAQPAADPASALEVIETQMRHLLSWKRIYSRTLAGESFLSASSGNAHSPQRTFLEVPGEPVPFSLSADRLTLPADGRQLVRIRSEPISDRYGNLLLDGSSVTLLASMANGEQRTLPTQTLDGRIDLTVQAPKLPGHMTLQAWIAGVSSRPLTIDFTAGPAVEEIRVSVIYQEETIKLRIGPLIGDLNQFIPDGSEVVVRITDPEGALIESSAIADYGYAELVLRRATLASGHYEVSVQAGTGTGATAFEIP